MSLWPQIMDEEQVKSRWLQDLRKVPSNKGARPINLDYELSGSQVRVSSNKLTCPSRLWIIKAKVAPDIRFIRFSSPTPTDDAEGNFWYKGYNLFNFTSSRMNRIQPADQGGDIMIKTFHFVAREFLREAALAKNSNLRPKFIRQLWKFNYCACVLRLLPKSRNFSKSLSEACLTLRRVVQCWNGYMK